MPAIGDRLLAQALTATASTIANIKDSLESPGESEEKARDEFLIDHEDSSSEQTSFTSVSADKVIHEDDGGTPFRVPKYFQALLTLFACFTMLLCTLTIIRQIRKLCRSSSCTRKIPMTRGDSDRERGLRPLMGPENGSDPNQQTSGNEGGAPGTPSTPMSKSDRKHFDYYHSPSASDPSSSKDSKETDKELNDALKLKRVRFVRRISTSGPFGDEALDFVGQTYKKKCKEVVQTEHLGQVPGKIRTQQSVRKQSKAAHAANAQHLAAQSPTATQR